mmetsp:Transcript_19103/g.22013  ORF Transcript_19103/g.22013 Transcript_19103/m.22013 type:complete len:227 (-) Transcript_19103:412-1092(-)
MLFSCLHRHSQSSLPIGINADSDHSPGHPVADVVLHRKERCVRSAEAHRHSEALGQPEGDVRAHLAGRLRQRQAQQVGADNEEGPRLVHLCGLARPVDDVAVEVWVLHQHAANIFARRKVDVARVADDHFDAERLGPRADDGDGVREGLVADEEDAPLLVEVREAHEHRLCARGRFVQQRGVRDVESGQVGHHRLEVEQVFEAALRDLRLVRCVGRVPVGVFEYVS